MLNYQLIWSLRQLVCKNNPASLRFLLGEIRLNASEEDYNVDGVIMFGGREIYLLDTSGPYALIDLPRFDYDHVKGLFGCISMMNKILKTWHFAKERSLRQLKKHFLHIRSKKPKGKIISVNIITGFKFRNMHLSLAFKYA